MNKEEMICIAGEEGIIKPLPLNNVEKYFQDIKKQFNYKDTDPTVYTSKTLNEQMNDWIKELKQETAKQIFEEIEKQFSFFRRYIDVNTAIACMFEVIEQLKQKYTGEPQ